MSALSLSHFRMLLAIRDSPSLGEAADKLGITQSAVTHRIREAERRLGCSLFAKVGRHLRPTAAAEILIETAELVLDRIASAERAATASSQGIRHVVRLTVCDYNTYHWLPGFMGWFREVRPDIEIEINPDRTAAALKRLSERQLDIAIMPAGVDTAGADGVRLFDDMLTVVVWPGHRFCGYRHVTAKDFETETYLTYSLASRPGFESERLWSHEGALPLRKRNLGSIDAVCELVKAQAGISVLSRWGITREINAGSLVAVQAGRTGLPIVWRALLTSSHSTDAPARVVCDGLAEWFSRRSGNPPADRSVGAA